MNEENDLARSMAKLAAKAPCKECGARHFRCHEACVEYQRYMAARRWVNERKQADSVERNANINRRRRIMRMFRKKGF